MKSKRKNPGSDGVIIFPTAVGNCRVEMGEQGIRRVAFAAGEALKSGGGTDLKNVARTLQQFLGGKRVALSGIRLDLRSLPAFHRRVYRALRRIPAGRTVTYGELARLAGSPKAARAVGQAMAGNPLPLLIPCHRVLASGGRLGGFSSPGGTQLKRQLLEIEGTPLNLTGGRHVTG